MRWGVRKESTSNTKNSVHQKLKKAAIVSGVTILAAGSVAASIFYGKKFVDLNTAVKLPAKTILQTVHKHGDDLKIDKATFASFKPKDNAIYSKSFVDELLSRPDSNGKAFKTLLETNKPINAPSVKQTFKLYDEYLRSRGVKSSKNTLVEIKNRNRNVHAGFESYGGPNSFEDFLSTRGYNAVIDVLDRGQGYKASRPIMIFNGQEDLIKKTTEQII